MRDLRHLCDVPVADELSVRIVVTGRKRKNFIGKANQINRFAGKKNFPIFAVPVVKRTNADRVARRDKGAAARVVNHQRELRIKHAEQIKSVLLIEREQDFAI